MRTIIQNLQESKIREVANSSMGLQDVLAFWFGESDEVTPEWIRQAAIDSLQKGDTFYSQNLGLPELQAAIADLMTQKHGPSVGGESIDSHRIAVCSGGVSALMIAVQALVDAGDQVVAVTPVWPNLTAQALIMGANLHCVPLQASQGQWSLNLASLLANINHNTRLLILNAPNNPTGWTLSREEQLAILNHCRKTGTWILADEVYENLYYEETVHHCAPSFLDLATAQDRLMVVHSFSKSYLMTGWRLGWLVMPTEMEASIGKLIEFNTSCASVFTQKAGIAAIQNRDQITPRLVQHLQQCRDVLVSALQKLPGLEVSLPKGGMYAFFKIEGHTDSLALAKRLVQEAGIGLAPGIAFAPEAEGWLRWCFASQDIQRLEQGVERLAKWLQQNKLNTHSPLVSQQKNQTPETPDNEFQMDLF